MSGFNIKRSLLFLILATCLCQASLFSQDIKSDTLANHYFKKANNFKTQPRLDSAAHYFHLAKELYEDQQNLEKHLESELRLTEVWILLKKKEEAQNENDRLLKEIKSTFGDSTILEAGVYKNIGLFYNVNNDFLKATEAYDYALSLYEKHPQKEYITDLGLLNNNIGVLYARRGYYDISAEYFERTVELYKSDSSRGKAGLASVYNNLGNLYTLMNNNARALDMFERSILLKQEIYGDENHPGLVFTYMNIASLFMTIGQLEEAIEYLNRNIAIMDNNEQARTAEDLAGTYGILSQVYTMQKKFDKAKKYSELMYNAQLENAGAESLEMAHDLLSMAFYHESTEQFDLALANYERAIEIFDIHNISTRQKARAESSVGFIKIVKGHTQQGLERINEAVSILRKKGISKGFDLSNIYVTTGKELLNEGEYKRAIQYLDSAIAANIKTAWKPGEANKPPVEQFVNPEVMFQALEHLIESHFSLYKQHKERIELDKSYYHLQMADTLVNYIQQETTNYSDKLAFRERVDHVYELAVEISYQFYKDSNDADYIGLAHYFMERNRNSLALLELSDSRARSFSNIPDSVLSHEEYLISQIAYHDSKVYELSKSNEADSEERLRHHEKQLFELRRKRNLLQQRIEQEYPDYARLKYDHTYISLDEVQSQLDNDATFIEYSLQNDNSYVILTNKDGSAFKPFSSSSSFFEILEDFRSQLIDPVGSEVEDFMKKSNALYNELLQPFESQLNQKLYIIPNGVLSLIPFGALVKSTSPEGSLSFKDLNYIIKTHDVSYLNSSFGLLDRDKDSNFNGLIAFSPSFDEEQVIAYNDTTRSGIAPLEFTEIEVDDISMLFESEIYKNEDATESSFKTYAQDRSIIHIASHGIVDLEKPYFSRIMFSSDSRDSVNDGILYLHEIYKMRFDAELAILSACNTGYGRVVEGEGVINLGNGFLGAGVKSVVNSLWLVNDKSTADLMRKFYYYLENGDNKDIALKKAKLQYLEKADVLHQHPFYWSTFVINGDMRPVVAKSNTLIYSVVILVGLLIGMMFFIRTRNRN